MTSDSTQITDARPTARCAWPLSIPPLAVAVISASSDIAILVCPFGVIEHASSPETDILDACKRWIGRSFVDVVSGDSIAKAQDLLAASTVDSPAPPREINHPLANGMTLTARYTSVPTGMDGRLVLVGRDLRPSALLQQRFLEAQQATEREYARLRVAETRYRIMFQFASEAILVIDPMNQKVVEANAAALQKFDLNADRIGSTTLSQLFSSMDAGPLETLIHSARSSGQMESAEIESGNGTPPIQLTARAFRHDGSSYLLIRVGLIGSEKALDAIETPVRQVHGMVEHAPDGCVIMDQRRNVLHANIAFLELAQLSSKQQVIGKSLDRWLGRPGIDLGLIEETLADHRVIRNFPTIIRGEFGGVEEVELSAVTSWSGDAGTTGFIIRSRRLVPEQQAEKRLPHSVQQMAQLVGQVPLKDLVRETSDLIEKLCIEAALDLSGDNRASAANMLGLSRQSFYAKLRRYNMGNLVANEFDEIT